MNRIIFNFFLSLLFLKSDFITSTTVLRRKLSTTSTSKNSPELTSMDIDRYENDKCTTIIVGPKAGSEGPMTTHTADCSDCDFRIAKVPAQDWAEGTMRPLYIYRGAYPSVVSPLRGTTWHPSNLQGSPDQLQAWGYESLITGYIPQVRHTYALFEGGYGIMNEHQVAMGESTCASRFFGVPVTAGGLAKIEVAEMSKIALERSTTARQAIQIMGDLATQLGFYAADWRGGDMSRGEGGEAMTVIDKTEAWVFHVLCDDTGASAVWAAQRLEPDHVAAVGNSFIIREIDPTSDSFMFSANIFEVAERNALWTSISGKKLDFLTTYAPMRSHSEYSTRRVWSVFRNVAPSANLPGDTDFYGNDYPFSIKTERVLFPADLMAMHRDHFEGTPYDLTKGVAAGPFNDPTRFDGAMNDNMTLASLMSGGYERAISMFRTSYSFVAQARPAVPDQLALLWFATYNPTSCSYAPFYVAAEHVPKGYTSGSLYAYDPSIAFWNFVAVGNYAGRFYKYAMQDVLAYQLLMHEQLLVALHEVESKVVNLFANNPYGPPYGNQGLIVNMLTDFTNAQGLKIITGWKELLPKMIGKFHDGYITMDIDKPTIRMKHMGYSKFWLEHTGYFENAGNEGPGVILFSPNNNPTKNNNTGINVIDDHWLLSVIIFTAIISSIMTLFISYYLTQRQHKLQYEYTPIIDKI